MQFIGNNKKSKNKYAKRENMIALCVLNDDTIVMCDKLEDKRKKEIIGIIRQLHWGNDTDDDDKEILLKEFLKDDILEYVKEGFNEEQKKELNKYKPDNSNEKSHSQSPPDTLARLRTLRGLLKGRKRKTKRKSNKKRKTKRKSIKKRKTKRKSIKKKRNLKKKKHK